jgi:hypothetical protein
MTNEWAQINVCVHRIRRQFAIDECLHQPEGTVFGFRTTGARCEGRAEGVKHTRHLVSQMLEVVGAMYKIG